MEERCQIAFELPRGLREALHAELKQQVNPPKMAVLMRNMIESYLESMASAREAGDPRLAPPPEARNRPVERPPQKPKPIRRGKKKGKVKNGKKAS